MGITPSSEQTAFWRADWFFAVVIVIAVSGLHLTTDFFGAGERRLYDFASVSTAHRPSDRIAVIAIDEQSIASLGRWPWSRDIHARVIDKLAAAKADTLVYAVPFFEPESDRGLYFVRKMKEVLATSGAPSNTYEPLARVIAEAEVALEPDRQLANSVKNAANVIIPSLFAPGRQPIESLAAAAAGVAYLNPVSDVDGVVRRVPLLIHFDAKTVPSIALLAAASGLHLTAADIKLNRNELVQIGSLRIGTDGAARMLPRFFRGRDGQPAFALDSFDDVLSGKIPATRYADKIVIIGVTAAGLGSQFVVPGNPALSTPEIIAHITSSILNEDFIVQPSWGIWVTLAVLLGVCAYLIAALPRLSAAAAAILSMVCLGAMLGAELGLLFGAALWLKMVFPAALLLIGHLALTIKRFFKADASQPHSEQESAETSRMMGLALQGQGQLDMAFDRFCRVPMGEAVMGNLYSLALDFERKRQFSKARAVYERMATHDQDYKDLKTKLQSAPVLLHAARLDATLVRDGGAGETLMLGRYRLERALGKGAMGVVYLGKDPKIGRLVAIKTMALSEEFDGADLLDARERFFREAETAGRLQHQNIVTIFDAGEDHGLAFIAMEFLPGKDLVDYCKQGHLLALPTVLSIVARVAEALAYAHRQNVVHRDIKPANVMYEISSDTVKVTDFGIARITDSSKTRTGMVLGTPSFMSPEQLVGKKVDGRSDLYSLGVMLYQMLTGALPFRGESMAELMHKIATEDAPDIRLFRSELPQSLANLVAVTLCKRPQARYQDGDQLARDLRAVLSGGNPIDLEI